jgi:hypothetical protein
MGKRCPLERPRCLPARLCSPAARTESRRRAASRASQRGAALSPSAAEAPGGQRLTHPPERSLPAPPAVPRRANPLATLSLILALLLTAGALLTWGTRLDKTGLVGGLGAFHCGSFAELWVNFLHLVAWWAGSLLCPVRAMVSHIGLRRVGEPQEGMTTGDLLPWQV